MNVKLSQINYIHIYIWYIPYIYIYIYVNVYLHQVEDNLMDWIFMNRFNN